MAEADRLLKVLNEKKKVKDAAKKDLENCKRIWQEQKSKQNRLLGQMKEETRDKEKYVAMIDELRAK